MYVGFLYIIVSFVDVSSSICACRDPGMEVFCLSLAQW